jgi:POT family proton-dependent oligopeptide transporter
MNREWLIYLLAILGVGIVWFMVQRNALVGTVLGFSTLLSLAAIAWIVAFVCKTWAQRQRMMLALVLIFGAVVFFTLFEQAGTSLNLFADRNVDLTITPYAMQFMGIPIGTPAQLAEAGVTPTGFWINATITAAQVQSFNAGFILIFAPIFAALWAWLASRKMDPNPTMKFGLGLVQVGLGFLVVVWAAGSGMVNNAFQMPLIILALLYMLHTTGELFLSPVGLSEITKLSLPSVVSFMMAVWFLASSIAQFVGGKIAGLMGTETVGGQVLDPQGALATSLDGFGKLGWWGVGIGVGFILISFLIKGWAHGVNDADNHPGPDVTDRGQEDGNIARPADSTPA